MNKNTLVKRKIVNWFRHWYGYSWNRTDSDEINELRALLKELK